MWCGGGIYIWRNDVDERRTCEVAHLAGTRLPIDNGRDRPDEAQCALALAAVLANQAACVDEGIPCAVGEESLARVKLHKATVESPHRAQVVEEHSAHLRGVAPVAAEDVRHGQGTDSNGGGNLAEESLDRFAHLHHTHRPCTDP